MSNSYDIAKKHLQAAIADAAANNVDVDQLGQALIWEVLQLYRENGRKSRDIVEEVQYTLDNINDDGIFHVSRN